MKPDQTDFYDVDNFNANADTIDAELKKLSDAIGNGGDDGDILTRLNNLETYVGDLTTLETEEKDNLVAAINEVRQKFATHSEDKKVHLQPGDSEKWNKLISNLGYGQDLETSILEWASTQMQNAYISVRTTHFPTDAPVQEEGFLKVIVGVNGFRVVKFTTFRGTNNNTTYVRPLFLNSWTVGWSRLLNDADYNQLFSLFGDKNRKIASAITEKGVPTNADATGDQMAANIRAINTGVYGEIPLNPIPQNGSVVVETPLFNFRPMNFSSTLPGIGLFKGFSTPPMNNAVNNLYLQNIVLVPIGNQYKLSITIRNTYANPSSINKIEYFISE